jgi:twitching motility protein PilT
MLATSLRAVIAQVLAGALDGGRVAAREVLLTTPSVANLIRQRKAFQLQSVMQTSKALGMVTLNDALMSLVERGEIDVSEAMSHTLDRAIMQTLLESKGYEIPPEADGGAEQPSGSPPRLERIEFSHDRALGG